MRIAAHRSGNTSVKQAGGEEFSQIKERGEGGGGVLVPHTTQTAKQHATSANTTTTALQPIIPEKQVGGELRSNKLINLTKLDTGGDLGTSHNPSSTTRLANLATTTQQPSTESQKLGIKQQIERYNKT